MSKRNSDPEKQLNSKQRKFKRHVNYTKQEPNQSYKTKNSFKYDRHIYCSYFMLRQLLLKLLLSGSVYTRGVSRRKDTKFSGLEAEIVTEGFYFGV